MTGADDEHPAERLVGQPFRTRWNLLSGERSSPGTSVPQRSDECWATIGHRYCRL